MCLHCCTLQKAKSSVSSKNQHTVFSLLCLHFALVCYTPVHLQNTLFLLKINAAVILFFFLEKFYTVVCKFFILSYALLRITKNLCTVVHYKKRTLYIFYTAVSAFYSALHFLPFTVLEGVINYLPTALTLLMGSLAVFLESVV